MVAFVFTSRIVVDRVCSDEKPGELAKSESKSEQVDYGTISIELENAKTALETG